MFEIEDETLKEERRLQRRKKNDKLFYIALGFLLLTLVLLLIYYLTSNKEEVKTPVKKPKVIEKKLKVFDEDSNERPIAFMIDNNIGEGLHAGLQESYINYEIIVEGGLTRIMSIYKDKDVELIGPIRSSRHYFLDYALEHDAIYTHYGWSPYAEKDIRSLGVNNVNGMTDGAPFERNKTIAAPHNVFTSTAKIRNYLDKKGYNKESDNWKDFNYSVDEINLSSENSEENTNNELKTANNVSMTYSPSQSRNYTYDDANKYYLRSMNGKAHIDKESNNQLHYKNIIIIKVNNKTLDNEGRQDLDTVGSGEGYFITNGYALPIKWSKLSRNSKMNLSYTDGSEVKLNDGNAFVQIVPLTSNITIN